MLGLDPRPSNPGFCPPYRMPQNACQDRKRCFSGPFFRRLRRAGSRLRDKRKPLLVAIVLISHLAGAITSLRAIFEVRTPQGTIAWVFALNTVPYASVPAYWVFGRQKFEGYALARRHNLELTSPMHEQYHKGLEDANLLTDAAHSRSGVMEKLARLRFTRGNGADLLVDGEETFRSIYEGIEQAQHYILVEFYIIRRDDCATEFKQRLMNKAREGVRVHVLYDEVGSSDLDDEALRELRAAGVEIRQFNSTQGRDNRWQINFRNHRKIIVVDGHSAWVGGLNIGDEYLGRDPDIGPWRDTHVKVTGPAAIGVQLAFLEDWHWASREILELDWNPRTDPAGGDVAALALPTGPADPLETCSLFFLSSINSATERLWIASPYFVPDESLICALQLAALRGVDVRLLLPDKIDSRLVELSAWSYLEELEKVGIPVYRYTDGLMHQKVMLIDDNYCTIGTANFDNRSFRLNFELTLVFVDPAFAAKVDEMLGEDFSRSRRVQAEELQAKGFWFRLGVRVARLMAPIQ